MWMSFLGRNLVAHINLDSVSLLSHNPKSREKQGESGPFSVLWNCPYESEQVALDPSAIADQESSAIALDSLIAGD